MQDENSSKKIEKNTLKQDNNESKKKSLTNISTYSLAYFKKVAFTLAEVLITLGIIGVVAALTMPNLIVKYQKMQYITALKKFVSVFEQATHQMMADTDCNDLQCTGFFDGDPTDEKYNNELEKNIKKYFKVIKVCKYGDKSCEKMAYALNGNPVAKRFDGGFTFITVDGILVNISPPFICRGSSKLLKCGFNVDIDVNGIKKPDIIGRDIHYFRLAQNGVLYPFKSKEFSLYYESDSYYWKLNDNCINLPSMGDSDSCTAKLIENGWVMDY